MKILDCTLRDGGYYTGWSFNEDVVKNLVKTSSSLGIDIIELGYKAPGKGGHYFKCNDEFINNIISDIDLNNSELAFMVDLKHFIEGTDIREVAVRNLIKPAEDSPFNWCRLAITPYQITHAKNFIKILDELGYKVVVNIMQIALLKDRDIKKCVTELNAIKEIEILYFADSFGSLTPDTTKNITEIFVENTDKPIGIHTHDNMGLAFANVLAAVNNGVTYVDGTYKGMGRGVGNVKLEQILMYEKKDNIQSLVDFLENYMEPLYKQHQWGWDVNYMHTGLENIHPSYCMHLKQLQLKTNDIHSQLVKIPQKNKRKVDYNLVQLKQKVAVVIPARYKSTRFPGKPLVNIKGKAMIVRVAEIAEKAVGKENVYIATEDTKIEKVVTEAGYKVVMTSDTCLTGTDRVAEASFEIDADIIVNIQGDEPLLNPDDISKVIEVKKRFPDKIINCMSRLTTYENPRDIKIPKVVTSLDNTLLYASRSPIPGSKKGIGDDIFKQVCIYAFTKNELKKFTSVLNGKTPLEWSEDIEINRFIELGLDVKMVELTGNTVAVDLPEDVEIVEKLLKSRR